MQWFNLFFTIMNNISIAILMYMFHTDAGPLNSFITGLPIGKNMSLWWLTHCVTQHFTLLHNVLGDSLPGGKNETI